MHTNFADALAELERQKRDLLAEVGEWSTEKLFHRPSPSEWSVVEMMDHLVKTEIAILAAAREGLRKPHRIGLGDKVRTRFLQRVFMSDRKVKVPASVSQVLPGSDLQWPLLLDRWQKSRWELQQFLKDHDHKLLSQGIFRHPIGGWMAMPEILNFFSVHLIHHNYQLVKIKNALRDGELSNVPMTGGNQQSN